MRLAQFCWRWFLVPVIIAMLIGAIMLDEIRAHRAKKKIDNA
jgi:hypothetical protein